MQDSGRPEKSPRPAQGDRLYQSLPDSSGRPALIALNHWRVETWARICRIFALVVVSAFVVFSIFTYYDRLSQYNTRDQDATLDRINLFLKDRDQSVLNAGSNLSNIIVGFPAKYVRSWLDLHFKEDDHLVGNIYYTRFLPLPSFKSQSVCCCFPAVSFFSGSYQIGSLRKIISIIFFRSRLS